MNDRIAVYTHHCQHTTTRPKKRLSATKRASDTGTFASEARRRVTDEAGRRESSVSQGRTSDSIFAEEDLQEECLSVAFRDSQRDERSNLHLFSAPVPQGTLVETLTYSIPSTS